MGLIQSFINHFGEDEADAVVCAAETHGWPWEAFNKGSDEFRWCIMMCLFYECFTDGRDDHWFESPWEEVDKWIMEHASIGHYDGDISTLMVNSGVYDRYMESQWKARKTTGT